MSLIKRLFFYNKIKKQKRIVSVFEELVGQNHMKNIEKNESEKNIEESLIEIVVEGQHSSNGILITDDGYFLTAKHCVDKNLERKSIRLYDGQIYPIEKVCAYAPNEDLALVKANIPNKCVPKKYKILENSLEIMNPLEKIPVNLMTRIDGKIIKKYGFIIPFHNYKILLEDEEKLISASNYLRLRISAKPGDSGGIVINTNKELIGIFCYGNKKNNATTANSKKALGLIEFYKKQVQRRLI